MREQTGWLPVLFEVTASGKELFKKNYFNNTIIKMAGLFTSLISEQHVFIEKAPKIQFDIVMYMYSTPTKFAFEK